MRYLTFFLVIETLLFCNFLTSHLKRRDIFSCPLSCLFSTRQQFLKEEVLLDKILGFSGEKPHVDIECQRDKPQPNVQALLFDKHLQFACYQ